MTSRGDDGWRIGILGAGQAGERHVAGFSAHPSAFVVGVADVDLDRAQACARGTGAVAVPDAAALLDLGVDVLVVATPHHAHLEPVLAACRAGVHLLVEKPIATTRDDGVRIVDAARDAGVALAVSFVHRFREESVRAKRWLDEAGEVRVGRETMSTRRTDAHPRWLTQRAVSGGGVLMYSAIHGVDRLRWFFGDEVVQVDARTQRFAGEDHDVEDGITMLLTFARGGSATLTANAPRYPADPTVWETEVHADQAMVRMRTRSFAERAGWSGSERYDAATDATLGSVHYNFARQAADLLDAIDAGRDPMVTGEDGMAALDVCLAAYASASAKAPVDVDAGSHARRTP